MIRTTIVLCMCLVGIYAAPRPRGDAPNGNHLKIMGGDKTYINKVPYQVAVTHGSVLCGGVIIDSTHILTAAHCAIGRNVEDFLVRAGSSEYESGGTEHTVQKVTIHPQYDVNLPGHDIAMLLLKEPIKFSANAKSIELAKREPRKGEIVTLAGWGADTFRGVKSWHLKSVKVPVVGRKKCEKLMNKHSPITEYMWCAGYPEGGKDACDGDSGGAAVVNNKLAGIVSWGNGCGQKNTPGVYTNIVKYTEWIKNQLR